jgi:hypothetical protein
MLSVQNFHLYKNGYIWKHLKSVSILSELHSETTFGEKFYLHMNSKGHILHTSL